MAMRIDIREKISGPVFDGKAEAVITKVLAETVKEAAATGRDWIKIAANSMDRSGRGGTGRAAEGVLLYDHGLTQTIFGEMKEGQVWWPWLEGVSKRNTSTHFGGYHTFRSTRARLVRHIDTIAERKLREHLPEIGGV